MVAASIVLVAVLVFRLYALDLLKSAFGIFKKNILINGHLLIFYKLKIAKKSRCERKILLIFSDSASRNTNKKLKFRITNKKVEVLKIVCHTLLLS